MASPVTKACSPLEARRTDMCPGVWPRLSTVRIPDTISAPGLIRVVRSVISLKAACVPGSCRASVPGRSRGGLDRSRNPTPCPKGHSVRLESASCRPWCPPAPQMVGMGVGEDDEVDGGRLDAGGLKAGPRRPSWIPASRRVGVDQHTPVTAFTERHHLGTDGVGSEMVRLHVLLQLGLARFVASNALGNVTSRR